MSVSRSRVDGDANPGRLTSNATEEAYNFALARLLRHEGLNAQAEQRRRIGQARAKDADPPDSDQFAVAVEAEFGAIATADSG